MRLIGIYRQLYNLRGNLMLEVYISQATCIHRNIRVLSRHHCRRSNTMRFTSSEYAMRYIVIRGLLRSIFVYIISLRARYSGKKSFNTKCVFWFPLKLLFETFLILKRNIISIHSLHVKYPIALLDYNVTWIFSTNFRKIHRFHENSPSGSRVVPCE
jgi:hypothetical protein